MKSQVRLYREDIADFYDWLPDDIEANTETVDWRVMMFRRKEQTQWTQVYDGLTRHAKNQRAFLRVFGPDEDLIEKFYERTENAT